MSSGFGSLGKLIQKVQKPASQESFGLVDALAKYLDGIEDEERQGFHISQLWKFCPVQWFLNQVVKKPKHIPFRLRYRFDIGHALHGMIQRYLGGMGVLKGFWKCDLGHQTSTISVKPEACPSCGSKVLRYQEISVEHVVEDNQSITGRTDGILFWEGEDMGLEVKSVEAEMLPSMSKPYDYPVYQLNLYMHLLRQGKLKGCVSQPFPNLRRGVILFIAASQKESVILPIRAFVIDYSPKPWEETFLKVKDALRFLADHRRHALNVHDLVVKRVCSTPSEGRKIDCQYCEECFGQVHLERLLHADSAV